MDELIARFQRLQPAVAPQTTASNGGASLRVSSTRSETVTVRQGVLLPVATHEDRGAMVTVRLPTGEGYGATSDLSDAGLRAALAQARSWAEATQGRLVAAPAPLPTTQGSYRSGLVDRPSLRERIDWLRELEGRLRVDPRIVDSHASLELRTVETLLLSDAGAQLRQHHVLCLPSLSATAYGDGESQTRTFGTDRGQQGGRTTTPLAELLHGQRPETLAEEAVALLSAPQCPSATMDLVLLPSQMMLQIHESIGHPLELDRILGDERNYAGTSFVTLDMFGSYRYGSSLLNVTFDPSRPEQLASYGYDDEGAAAERVYLIREGILLRPLGGTSSQLRTPGLGAGGTANARACSWNRPPIDRMANLNVEPGTSTLDELVAGIDDGVMLETNRSWSIDDSRNKFQFGCELGWRIRGGRVERGSAGLVRNPNYRGVSATFWRSLDGVGAADTLGVYGTPMCGKGEPNQVIHVGHASPACRFRNVDVFGAA
jgi:predicted Zn-dependent protease